MSRSAHEELIIREMNFVTSTVPSFVSSLKSRHGLFVLANEKLIQNRVCPISDTED